MSYKYLITETFYEPRLIIETGQTEDLFFPFRVIIYTLICSQVKSVIKSEDILHKSNLNICRLKKREGGGGADIGNAVIHCCPYTVVPVTEQCQYCIVVQSILSIYMPQFFSLVIDHKHSIIQGA